MKKYLNFGNLLLFCFLIAGTWMTLQRIPVADLWWQLKSGQLIADSLCIPRHDPFSFTAAGAVWINHEWLACLIFYQLYSVAGFTLLYAFKSIIIILSYLIVIYTSYRVTGKSLVPCCLAGIWMLFISGGNLYFDIRPYLFTYISLALTVSILYESYLKKKPKMLFFLVPILLIWVNSHGGYILSYILQSSFLISAFITTKFRHKGPPWLIFFFLSLTGVVLLLKMSLIYILSGLFFIAAGVYICMSLLKLKDEIYPEYENNFFTKAVGALGLSAAVGFLNPYGPEIFLYPFTFLKDSYYKNFLIEWIPPDLMGRNLPLFITVIVLLILSVLFYRKLKVYDYIMISVFSYLSLTVVRHAVLFSFAMIPVSAQLIKALTEYFSGSQSADDSSFQIKKKQLIIKFQQFSPCIVGVLFVLTAILSAFIFFIPGKYIIDYKNLSMEKDLFPVAGVQFVSANRLKGNIFTPYEWGGYFIWKLYPDYKVFIDGRANTLYPESLYRESLLTMSGYPGWEEAKQANIPGWEQLKSYNFPGWKAIMDKYEINYIFCNKFLWKTSGQKLADRLLEDRNNWVLIFEDRTEMLFIRNVSKNREIIDAAREGRLKQPITPYYLNRQAELLLNGNNMEQAEKLIMEALILDPDDTDSLTKLGYILFTKNQTMKAKEVFQKILSMNPEDPNACYYLGRILENEGKEDEAAQCYTKVLKFSPDFAPAKESLKRVQTGRK